MLSTLRLPQEFTSVADENILHLMLHVTYIREGGVKLIGEKDLKSVIVLTLPA